MTPGARLSAAIEVLDEIAASRAPADEVLKAWGRSHRFAGSKDRRAIGERVYQVLRARPRLAWSMGEETGRALVIYALAALDGLDVPDIEALCNGEGHAPRPLSAGERARLGTPPEPEPDWVEAGVPTFVADALKASFGQTWLAEAHALIGARAPVDLRVNTLRGGVDGAVSLLAVDGLESTPTPWSALGLRLLPDIAPDIHRLRAFKSGWIDIQDEASQIAAALADAGPERVVIDYCAGGGGKTLALGAAMRRSGRLLALDVSSSRLAAMRPRLERAEVAAEVRRIGGEGEGTEDLIAVADVVFVDAPCSGSGTWRRHPEGAWRLKPEGVTRLAALQAGILTRASALVRPGGRLVYATCSVLAQENQSVAQAFALGAPAFRPVPIASAATSSGLTDAGRDRLAALAGDGHTLQLTPLRTGTDGFFVALFERGP